jgi:hypothetical protein
LPVRSVIAPPQPAQKQMPVRRVGPLTILGATIAGLLLLSSIWTTSNSSLSTIAGTAIPSADRSATPSQIDLGRTLH